MKLKDYLEEEGIKKVVFARKVGITPTTLNTLISGAKDITLSLACRIEDLTDGEVKCRDMVNLKFIKRYKQRSKELKLLHKEK